MTNYEKSSEYSLLIKNISNDSLITVSKPFIFVETDEEEKSNDKL